MSIAARRIRAGDVILATGSLLLLVALLAHVAAAPATPPPVRTAPRPGPVSAGVPDGPATLQAGAFSPAAPAFPFSVSGSEPRAFVPDSKHIRTWKDLPAHVLHRPHWMSRRDAPKSESVDYRIRSAELHLELLGYDAESIKFAFDVVNRLDAALGEPRDGVDAVARLLDFARGGRDAAELAKRIGDGADEEAVRVRAIALLAAHGPSRGVAEALAALAGSDSPGAVRTAAGASLLWMGRDGDVARWISTEGAPGVVSDFLDSVQVGAHRLDDRRPPKTLVFSPIRAVESSALVDALLEGSAPARWDPETRAKMYPIAAQYGGDRRDVSAWMEREYAGATTDLARASILFAAPRLADFAALEDRAVEVVRSGGTGYVVRTALYALGQFRTERSLRVLMEAAPKCGEDTAPHAIRSLEKLAPWYGAEVERFLRGLAEGHPDAGVRAEAQAAVNRAFAPSAK